ncbi:MAG: ASCH domain-containing protein [Leptolyngbyaceae cyanobacterium]
MSSKVLLFSIHPEHCDNIFKGIKTVELRRTRPKAKSGDIIIVYASSPEKSVKGIVSVDKVVELPIDQLWLSVEDQAAINHELFLSYFSGASKGCGIFLERKFYRPVTSIGLGDLRKSWSGFHPPQSYRYLRQNEIDIFDQLFDFDVRKASKFCQATIPFNS